MTLRAIGVGLVKALWMASFMALTGVTLSACQSPPTEQAAEALYTCSMHPQVIEDAPGSCPLCGMDLVPMGATQGAQVSVEAGFQQVMGLRTAQIQRQTVFRHLRALGEVEVGEDELSVVNLRYSGWVERIAVDRTGDPVTAGQVLFEIWSPELFAAQEELLSARRSQGAQSELAQASAAKLKSLGLSAGDIQRVVTAGEPQRSWPVRAPRAGFVLHKDIVRGARVQAGRDLYRIGDLRRIWVTADIYEYDAPWVEVGQPAQMELSYQRGEVLQGEVSYIYPTLNPATRTLRVRLEFDNPGIRLKPGMFATVNIQFRRKDDVLAVPTEAILHSGEKEIVFIALGDGRFEPREIVTGLVGDRQLTEVLDGLAEGEEVVVSGQFLLDSESQLQEALAKLTAHSHGAHSEGAHGEGAHPEELWSCPMHPEVLSAEPSTCPSCGMDLELRPATDAERAQLFGAPPVAQPGQYTCPMHPEVIEEEPGRCPICKMFLEQVPEGEDEGKDEAADEAQAP